MDDEVLTVVRRFLAASAGGGDVAAAMTALAERTARLPLTRLETWERTLSTELWKFDQQRSAGRWKSWKTPTRFVSWLDLCSSDGFQRERALRVLSDGAPNGFFCALALRRLNDWVPEVRAAAREQVPLIARRSDPEHVVDALWAALPYSTSWGRIEDDDRRTLSDLAGIEAVAVALKSRIVTATAGPAAAILAQAGRGPALDEWLGELLISAIQPSVRATACRALLEGRTSWVEGRTWRWIDVKWCRGRYEPVIGTRPIHIEVSPLEVLRQAAADRSPIVRRAAGDLLIERLQQLGESSRGLASMLAADATPSVAERGQFALTKLATAAPI